MIHYKEALDNVEKGSFMIITAESRMYMGGSVTETIYVKDEEVKARLIKINNEWRMRLSELNKELRDADDRNYHIRLSSPKKEEFYRKMSRAKVAYYVMASIITGCLLTITYLIHHGTN